MDRSANGNQNVGSDFAEKFSYLFEGLLSEFSEETGYDLGTYFFYDWKRDQLVEVNSKDYLKCWSICSAIPDQNRENYGRSEQVASVPTVERPLFKVVVYC